ncbi:hypothetical protein HDU76_008449 [Blyttiomyces sp. JEL0837]|nr:hypothetical protein HDU76_008449 [Blyttiomyces sp. JEL0837]
MDNQDITSEIRDPNVTKLVSHIASIPGVRSSLLTLQRSLSQNANVIMEGRDIGTAVLPSANVKIYLTGNPEIRAKRRMKELVVAGKMREGDTDGFEKLVKDIVERDLMDMERKVSPLRKAEDAIVVDTSFLEMAEQVDIVEGLVRERLEGK